jgi:hypothetical protein
MKLVYLSDQGLGNISIRNHLINIQAVRTALLLQQVLTSAAVVWGSVGLTLTLTLTYTHAHTSTHSHLFTPPHTYIHTRTSTHLYAHTYTHSHLFTPPTLIYTLALLHTYTLTLIHSHTHTGCLHFSKASLTKEGGGPEKTANSCSRPNASTLLDTLEQDKLNVPRCVW